MNIIFTTHSSFLKQNFPYLRQLLLGGGSDYFYQDDPTQPNYVASFSFQPQPVLKLEKFDQVDHLTHSNQLAYQPVYQDNAQPTPQVAALPNFWTEFANNLLNVFFGLLMLSASVVLIALYSPDLYRSIFKDKAQNNANSAAISQEKSLNNLAEAQSFAENQVEEPVPTPVQTRYLPEQNLNLPVGDWLTIPLIGVNTQLQKTPTAEEALSTGVWWVPEFGLPGDLTKPMIVSGHRYGWEWWWKSDYWRYHSFYRLPELQPGDLIEIISEQRKWTYEVYAGEEGTEITDYQADLILYTCKFLNSPLRVFRYAKLVKS